MKTLREHNTKLFAIGIGKASVSELQEIGDKPFAKHVFYADEYHQVEQFQSNLVRYICHAAGGFGDVLPVKATPPPQLSFCPKSNLISQHIEKVPRIRKVRGVKLRGQEKESGPSFRLSTKRFLRYVTHFSRIQTLFSKFFLFL